MGCRRDRRRRRWRDLPSPTKTGMPAARAAEQGSAGWSGESAAGIGGIRRPLRELWGRVGWATRRVRGRGRGLRVGRLFRFWNQPSNFHDKHYISYDLSFPFFGKSADKSLTLFQPIGGTWGTF